MEEQRILGSNEDAGLFGGPRRIWDLELLISGAVVFALFQVPPALDQLFFRLEIHMSHGQRFTLFFAYAYCKMIVLVLILAFLLHLLARAYWIGLLGLQRVFPEGILWSEVKEGPIMVEELRRLPTVPERAERTDRLASSIFSFSFMLVYFFAFSVFLVAGLAAVAYLISITILPGIDMVKAFWVVLVLWVIPSSLPAMIDKSYRRRKKDPPEKLKRLLRPLIRGNLRLMLAGFYTPVFYTFATHLKGRRAYFLLLGGFVSMFVLLFGQLSVAKRSDSVIHGYRYLPPSHGELTVRNQYYDNLRTPDARWAHLPSLSSDIADGPFLKLFLPYRPFSDNEVLEVNCPEARPWEWSFKRSKEPVSIERQREAVECLAKLYTIELDGQPLELELDFYRHPQTEARGLLAYLRTSELEPGRHVLRLEDQQIDPEEEPKIHYIPFRR